MTSLLAHFGGLVEVQASDLRLQWRVPVGAECPTSAQVAAQVDGLLGTADASGRRPGLRAVATVSAKGSGFTVRIQTEVQGSVGERVLAGDSCSEVASATALILAMALDPDAVRGAPPGPPPPAPPPPESPVPSRPQQQQTRIEPAASGARVALVPVVLGTAGVLPGTAFGVGVTAFLRPVRAWALAVSAHDLPAVSGRSLARPETGGNFSLAGGAAQLCRVSGNGTDVGGIGTLMRFCGGLNLDRLTATGFGVTDPGRASTWLVAAQTTVGMEWMLTARLGFSLSLGATMPISRPLFVLDGVGTVWRPSAVGARLGMGVAVGL